MTEKKNKEECSIEQRWGSYVVVWEVVDTDAKGKNRIVARYTDAKAAVQHVLNEKRCSVRMILAE